MAGIREATRAVNERSELPLSAALLIAYQLHTVALLVSATTRLQASQKAGVRNWVLSLIKSICVAAAGYVIKREVVAILFVVMMRVEGKEQGSKWHPSF